MVDTDGVLTKPTVLVVDDTPENLSLVSELLKEDYRVRVASNGEKALKIAGSVNPPDIILLDIMMPLMDGYEVCQRLKAETTTRDIPVIFLTAKTEIADEIKGFSLGAVDYITKPLSPPIVKARVKNHLRLKNALKHLEKQNEILLENINLREDMERISRHDLKTPLNSIISLPRILLQDNRLGPDQVELLTAIEKSGYTMLNMINLSLDLFKMEKGTCQLEPVGLDLLSIIRKIIFDLRSTAEARAIKFHVLIDHREVVDEATFGVRGEELLCYSMLANLIKNAVEASPADGIVKILLSEENGQAQICIHNQGVVPAHIRGHFFEKYSTSGKAGGTGLGAYSAKLMAETMGGGISMSTSETDGTTITLQLKPASVGSIAFLRSVATISGHHDHADMEQVPPLKILIVDDDEDNRMILGRYLNDHHFNIEFAGNGQSAFEKFTQMKFNIIFMDMEMPVMNGMDAALRMRHWESEKSGEGDTTILVALSGHDAADIGQTCLKAGFNAYLSKPVSKRQLLETILNFFADKHNMTPEPQNHTICLTDQSPADSLDVEIDSDLQDLIPSLLNDKRAELETIGEMLKANDYDRIQKMGHKLKGAFNMYGFKFPGEISSSIEEAAKRKDYDGIKNKMELLHEYLGKIRIKYVNMN
jgi:CheY-like chemotaxis protein